MIHQWTYFEDAFINNFEGTYRRPGSAYDLHKFFQGDKELVRNFIACWLKKRNSLISVSDEKAILSFISRVHEPILCHKLSRKQVGDTLTTMA